MNTDRIKFEIAANITCKNKNPEFFTIDKCIEYLRNNATKLSVRQGVNIEEVISIYLYQKCD